MDSRKQIIIVGGGAAGLLAAIRASELGGTVILIEKMRELGRKILISGKGRCNVTNDCDREEFLRAFGREGRFLYSAWDELDNKKLRELLHAWGCPTVVERGQRVFPVSQSAREVRDLLVTKAEAVGVKIWSDSLVREIKRVKSHFQVTLKSGVKVEAEKLILATGGVSYPGTGSSGDGVMWAKNLGHQIVPLRGALVPLVTEEEWVPLLQGLSLKNVRASLWQKGKEKESDFGEMLFTHYGVSGPIVLTMSKLAGELLEKEEPLWLKIDLKPALSVEQLDARIQRDFEKFSRKKAENGFDELLPQKLIPVMLELAKIDPEKPIHQITRKERLVLLENIKNLTMKVVEQRPIAEAIVTAGGVNLKEVNPQTMESKLIPNLYFAGEILNLSGWTGGYNLQAAFSTGWVAGQSAVE